MKVSDYYNEESGEVNDKRIKGVIIKVVIAFFLLSAIGWGIRLITTPARTVSGVIEKTLDADNVIYNYEWFKQQWEDYLAINQKIQTSESQVNLFRDDAGPRDKWTFEDKAESARLNAITQGLKNQRNDLVATYNARSKMVNRSIFKYGVPHTIEIGG